MANLAKRPAKPGNAWEWNGNKWVKPDKPHKALVWDDDRGWVRPQRPGSAWNWNPDRGWVRPKNPGSGETWDDNNGWINPPRGAGGMGDGQVADESPAAVAGPSVSPPPNSDSPTVTVPGQEPPSSGSGNTPPAATTPATPTVVRQLPPRYEAGGWMVTYNLMSDNSEVEIYRERSRGAGDAAAAMFSVVGLGTEFTSALTSIIDGLYQSNIKPTEEEILNSIYNSEPYRQRFSGNNAIRERMSSGNARPGDHIMSPAEYIDYENKIRNLAYEYSLPTGFYDTNEEIASLIANGIDPAEFEQRAKDAHIALDESDQGTVRALQEFYGLTKGDLAAYLLDPTKAEPILNSRQLSGNYGLNSRTELERMYSTAEVGGSGIRAGVGADLALAQDIVDTGNAQQADAAISNAAANKADIKRLGALYGEAMDYQDLVRESLNLSGGTQAGQKRKRFASKERAAFNAQGALDKSSLTRQRDV